MFFPIGDERKRPGFVPYIVWSILILNVLVYLYEMSIAVQGGEEAFSAFLASFGMVPRWITNYEGRPPDYNGLFSVFSSMFLHAGAFHLLGNMLFLWIFADNIEDLLGPVWFLFFYLSCGLVAAGAHLFLHPASPVPVVGASGAISGVLGAYVLKFPFNRIKTVYWFWWFFYGTAQIRAIYYLGFWFLLQFVYAGLSAGGSGGGVAYGAHLGGFLAGIVLVNVFPLNQKVIAYYREITREWW